MPSRLVPADQSSANPLAPAQPPAARATIYYLVSRCNGVEALELASPDGRLMHALAADRDKTSARFAATTGLPLTTHEVRVVEVPLFGGPAGEGGVPAGTAN